MPIDPSMEEAVRESVSEQGQSPQLTSYLLAWLNAVISGNEDVKGQSADRRLELLYAETVVEQNASNGDE